MYSKDNHSGYMDSLKNKATAVVTGGIFFLAGCGGINTVPEHDVTKQKSYEISKLQENPQLKKEMLGNCDEVSPKAYANFLKELPGNDNTREEIAQKYGSVNLEEVTNEDLAIGNPACLYLPKNIHVSEDLEQGKLEEMVNKNLSEKEIEDATEKEGSVFGGMYKKNGTYWVVPDGDHDTLRILDEALDTKREKEYGNVQVGQVLTYNIKQGDRNLGTISIYEAEGYGGRIAPEVDLFANSYRVGPTKISEEKVKEYAKESEVVSHKTDSHGAMEARIGSALGTAAPLAFLSPYAAGLTAIVNLGHAQGFDNVLSYDKKNIYVTENSLADLVNNEQDSQTTTIISPVYDKEQVVGAIRYDIRSPQDDVKIGRKGIGVKTSHKFMTATGGDIARALYTGTAFRIGELSADGGGGSSDSVEREGGPGANTPGDDVSRTGGSGVGSN